MDLEESIEAPAMTWFWPIRPKPQASDSDEADEDEAVDLKQIAAATDEEADESDQPEDTEDDGVEYEVNAFPWNIVFFPIIHCMSCVISYSNVVLYDLLLNHLQTSEKLEMLTDYLRTTYCYCHWCGIKYENADDMQTNCPGQTKDDH